MADEVGIYVARDQAGLVVVGLTAAQRGQLSLLADRLDEDPNRGAVSVAEEELAAVVALLRELAGDG